MKPSLHGRLSSDRRGVTALEYALVCPVFLMFAFGLVGFYSILQAQRALDFGVERALRYAAVHGGGGATGVASAFCTAAGLIAPSVNSSTCTTANVTVTPSSFTANTTVQVTATYVWNPPANWTWIPSGTANASATPMFPVITLTSTGKMYIVY